MTIYSFSPSQPERLLRRRIIPAMNETTVDHRTRVAWSDANACAPPDRKRDARVRRKGVGASVIQDVIAAADVSQGTFYKYFRTNEDLLAAVTQELNDELLRLIEAEVHGYEDPALRIAWCAHVPARGARVSAAGALHLRGRPAFRGAEQPDLRVPAAAYRAGSGTGRFTHVGVGTALDVIAGTALATILRITNEGPQNVAPEPVVAAILRALGVERLEAEKLVEAVLPPIETPDTSLLERGHADAGSTAPEFDRRRRTARNTNRVALDP